MASENYFQLFGLPCRYALDSASLDHTWRALAARVHPDRFAMAGAAERRVAMQWASTINEAYRILKSPLDRARYLCELSGCDVQAESAAGMDSGFLMLQIALREQLDEAREQGRLGAFEELAAEIQRACAAMDGDMVALIDQQHDFEQAAKKIREWMFIEKLAQEVDTSLSDLSKQLH